MRENGCLALMQNRELADFMREEAAFITDRDRLLSTLSEEQQLELKASLALKRKSLRMDEG